MDFLNDLGTRYEGLFTLASSLFGIAGFVFGWWRFVKERKVREDLAQSKRELDDALSRLKHLDDFAAGIEKYKRAV